MNKYLSAPILLTITWLLFSLFPNIGLLVVFSLLEVVSWLTLKIRIEGDNKFFVFSWLFYGVMAISTLFIYFKMKKLWEEIVLGLIYFCFATVSLFPLMLRVFSSVEPPYSLDFIVITFIAGFMLATVGLMKFKRKTE